MSAPLNSVFGAEADVRSGTASYGDDTELTDLHACGSPFGKHFLGYRTAHRPENVLE